MKSFAVTVVVLAAVLSLHGAVQAQTPNPVVTAMPAEASKEAMQVSGFVPVAAGATISVEALDSVTIRGVTCATSTSVASGDAPIGASRAALTIDRACVDKASGNLRICWGANQCQGIEFQPGGHVDLGRIALKASAQYPPDAGFGPADEHTASSGSNRIAYALGAAAFALAALALIFGASAVFGGRRKPA